MSTEARYFTVKQFNRITYGAAHVIVKYRKYMRLIDKVFRSQIMVAVSSVNKCRVCSYVHTKGLIKSGISNEELKDILDGSFENLTEEISLALIFAQHYADQVGKYDQEAFNKIIDYYGKEYAYGIMTTIKIIMFGNTNGIALTNLSNRLRFKKVKNAKFLTDLYNGFAGYVLLPFFIIINLFTKKKTF